MKYEYCCKCGCATGKAGAGDDSLYTEHDGPFCEDCFPDAQPKQEQGEPVAMQMDVIVVNLVREGINKHRARELAEHFIKHTTPQPAQKPLTNERLELVGHADLAINNIYIFNGYGEDVPEGRTPIYAGYKAAHGIKE